MNDYGLLEGLKRLNRAVKARGLEQISDLNADHRKLCQRASDIFDSIKDEAGIDPDHGNGTGAIIKQQVSTIQGYWRRWSSSRIGSRVPKEIARTRTTRHRRGPGTKEENGACRGSTITTMTPRTGSSRLSMAAAPAAPAAPGTWLTAFA